MEKKGFWVKYGSYIITLLIVVAALASYSFLTVQQEVDNNGKPIEGGKRTKTRFSIGKKKAA